MIDWPRIVFTAVLFILWSWGISQFSRLQRLEDACERAWFALNEELLHRHVLALKAAAEADACTPERQALSEEVTAVVRACAARTGWVGDPERMDNEARLTERLSRLTTSGKTLGDSGGNVNLSSLSGDVLRSEQRIQEALEAHNQAAMVLSETVQARISGLIARGAGIQARPPLPRVC